jgi:hypothetical protein
MSWLVDRLTGSAALLGAAWMASRSGDVRRAVAGQEDYGSAP